MPTAAARTMRAAVSFLGHMGAQLQHVDDAVRILISMPGWLGASLPTRVLGALGVLLVCTSLGHADEGVDEAPSPAPIQAEPDSDTQAYLRFQEAARGRGPPEATPPQAVPGRGRRGGTPARPRARQARPPRPGGPRGVAERKPRPRRHE